MREVVVRPWLADSASDSHDVHGPLPEVPCPLCRSYDDGVGGVNLYTAIQQMQRLNNPVRIEDVFHRHPSLVECPGVIAGRLALNGLDVRYLGTGSSVFHHVAHEGTKTDKGRRTFALPPSAALVLKHHKEQQMVQKLVLGTTLKDDDLVFSPVDGKPLLPDTASHAWVKSVKCAGLKHFRLHDVRHTHASLLLKQNVHPKVVKERLGSFHYLNNVRPV